MKRKKGELVVRDVITGGRAGTIPDVFAMRVEQTPQAPAYMQYDYATQQWRTYSWKDSQIQLERYVEALACLDLEKGDRVGVYLENSLEWVWFDLAAMKLGLIVVPFYILDNVENIAYVLADSGCKLIFLRNEKSWMKLIRFQEILPDLHYVLFLEDKGEWEDTTDLKCLQLSEVKEQFPGGSEPRVEIFADDPATIVYTSGTTGRPKGVVLSHHNILSDAEAVLKVLPAYENDLFLSFLPLSHTFERTAGYYIPMMAGCTVAYARSIPDLAEDIINLKPSILIAVPRIYEKIYIKIIDQLERKSGLAKLLFHWTLRVGKKRFEAQQNRQKISWFQQLAWIFLKQFVVNKINKIFGGRLRISVSGGAYLGIKISDFFLSLGVPLIQGYGLTECSPVVSVNSLEENVPVSVGRPLPGMEVRVDSQGELLVKGPNVMLGYWNREEETQKVLSSDGWLKTGDLVRMEQGHLIIRGRMKDILVTSTGEKISPSDLEKALLEDPLFQQAIVVGDGKPFIVAVVVLNFIAWKALAEEYDLDPGELSALRHPRIKKVALARCVAQTAHFPSYAKIRDVGVTLLPWTVENGLLTQTLKIKRQVVEKRLALQISELYKGHHLP